MEFQLSIIIMTTLLSFVASEIVYIQKEAQPDYQEEPQHGYTQNNHQSHVETLHYHEKPSSRDAHAKIVKNDLVKDEHGYSYEYETSNGIKQHERGHDDGHGMRAKGSYSYIGDDGHVYTVDYIADEHGFQAHGEHIPKEQPLPEAILKSLEENAKDEANGIYDDGSYRHGHNTEDESNHVNTEHKFQHVIPSHHYSARIPQHHEYESHYPTQHETYTNTGEQDEHQTPQADEVLVYQHAEQEENTDYYKQ